MADLGSASVIVDREGRVLLVKHGYGRLNWEIPGGGAEPHESAEDTARREAREEVGIGLEIERLSGVYWDPVWSEGRGLHHFVFAARIAAVSGEPRVADQNEITDLGWFWPAALPRPISDFTVRRIEDALSGRPAALTVIAERIWLT